MSNNLHYIKKCRALVEKFGNENDPENLNDASIQLQKVNLKNENNATTLTHVRITTLLQWLNLIQIFDDNIDPSFDANKGGSSKVMQRNIFDDGARDAQADPATSDAAKKAAQENHKKVEKYNMQVSLSRMIQHITPMAKTFIRKNYTGLPNDQLELRSAIEKTLKNQTRKDDFSTLLVPLPSK